MDSTVPRNIRAVLALAIATIAAIGVLLILPLAPPIQYLPPFVIAVGMLAILSLVPIAVGQLRAPPNTGLAYLAYRLRFAEFSVEEEPGRLKVRIGPLLVLRFDAVPTAEGSRVRYRWEPSPVGWTGYLLVWGLVFFLPTGVPALLVILRLWRFNARVLAPIVPASGELPSIPGVEAVRAALVNGLSECHRLAREAYEATRTRYWDSQGIVILAGVLATGLLLLVSVLVSPEPDAVRRVLGAIPLAVAGGIAAAVPLGLLVRRRIRPRLLRYREWADRLRALLRREIVGSAPQDEGESSFEALMAASREVPEWVDARRRAGLSADLGMWSLFVIVLGWSIELLAIGAYQLGTAPLVGLAAIVGSLPFIGALYLWWRWWGKRQREGATRALDAWTARFDALRAQMESYLEGL